jgi:hypothetical protein
MSEPTAPRELCSQCDTPLGTRRVTISERDIGTVVSEWVLCSWVCARELGVRFVRFGRDEH